MNNKDTTSFNNLQSYLAKMRGGAPLPAPAPLKLVGIAWLGGCIAIGIISLLVSITHQPLLLGSFGASCVLLFGFPDSPFSQPRNVIVGHTIASLTGLIFFHFLGNEWWSIALATGSAIACMQLTRSVHPPAGSNPVIVMLAMPGWQFLLTPTLIGAFALVAVALFFNNIFRDRSYPIYWF